MGLKEFLMPDWRKIVVFVILFLLPLPAPVECPMVCTFDPVKNVGTCTKCPLELMPIGFILVGMLQSAYLPILIQITLLLAILLQYIISCLIVCIYDKLKKKPEKKKRK